MLRNVVFVAVFVLLTVLLVFMLVALGDIFTPDFMDWLADGPKEKLFIRSVYIFLIFFHAPAMLSLLVVTALLFKKKRSTGHETTQS